MFHTDACRKRVAENETGHAGDRTRRAKQGEMGFTEREVGETDQKKKEVLQVVADKESGKRLRVAEDERLFPLLTGRTTDGFQRERREENVGRQKTRQTTAVMRISRKGLRSVEASRIKKIRVAFGWLPVEKLRGPSGRRGRRDYG